MGRWVIDTVGTEALIAWGDVELTAPTRGGSRNKVWYGLVNGEARVIRRSQRATEALSWELEAVESVRALGLRVPATIPTLAGESQHGGIVVHERVEGRPPDSENDWRRVAAYLQELHGGVGEIAQRPGFTSSLDLLGVDSGGDVDLSKMPPGAVRRCREAWRRLEGRPTTLVHGDPGRSNILMSDGRVVLIDWDECRVDVPLLDLAALPAAASTLDVAQAWVASQAASAWEAAVSWTAEPEYARRRLAELEE